MSISDTISQTAATNPAVGAAVATQSVKSALLAGMQTGDTATASLLGALDSQSMEANSLLSSISGLGSKLDMKA
mgnify:CR=1 FL=1